MFVEDEATSLVFRMPLAGVAALEREGGTIAVETRVGEGSTFRIRLPLAEGRAA